MIQALWIITDTGQCIFSHKYIKMDLEDQLISGLLTAFQSFSSESGIGGVQQIGGEDNQFVYGIQTGKILVAALADKKDNAQLVEKLMNKISISFQDKYSIYLTDEMYIDLNVFNGFENNIDEILFPKIYRRGFGSTIFATFVTILMTAGVLFLLLDLIQRTQSTFIIFLAFIPGLFIGAIIAGKRSYALISSFVGVIPIVAISIFYIVVDNINESTGLIDDINGVVFTTILMTEQFLTIAILCAILGGGLMEQRRLFPFTKGIEKIETKLENLLEPQIQPQEDYYQQESFQQQDSNDQSPFIENQQLEPSHIKQQEYYPPQDEQKDRNNY
ncbi:MAG: hypothetical protein EAX90_00745 [Candidatus Heimdallarchaeota archaeon]|nr:hypothetical protein [Candidatus Heimdallarchaeota archaeon]